MIMRAMRLFVCIMLFTSAVFFPLLSSADKPADRSRYGIYGGYGLNFHSADFQKVPDCPSCSPGYKDGDGSGVSFGLVYDYPISSGLYLSSKLLYKSLNGELISRERTTIISKNTPLIGEFEHSFDATLGIIGIEPAIKINLIEQLNLNIGINLSYLLTKDYSQVERIVQPSTHGTFQNPDGSDSYSRERNKFSGTLQKASIINIAPMASISYILPLDQKGEFLLEPEAAYYFGLSNIVNDDLVSKWKVNTLNFGIALKYSPITDKPKVKEEKYYEQFKIDTIRIEKEVIVTNYSVGSETVKTDLSETDTQIITTKIISRTDTVFTQKMYKLDGSIVAVGVDSLNNEIQNPIFTINEYISNRLDPLLNYVFFDDNSSALPSRYRQLDEVQTQKFEINGLFQETTLDIYYNLLNIVAKRMFENPTANITLTGCNSDLDAEKGNIVLSENRANTVKNYLTNIWKIDGSRIKTEKRNLPLKASTPKDDADKIQENRRVEIYSDNPKILEPIFIEKIDRSAYPPIVRYKLEAKSDLSIKNWELKAYQNSTIAQPFIRNGQGTVLNNIDWILSENQKLIPKHDELLQCGLLLTDEKGNNKSVKGNDLRIDVKTIQETRREMQGNYEIERFSLILFDFDKSNIEGTNKRIIDFISGRIKQNSEVEITGYTDRTGEVEYNKILSAKRAEATKSALKLTSASAQGIGEEELLYNNDIPEGRFYSRTVNITVKTLVK